MRKVLWFALAAMVCLGVFATPYAHSQELRLAQVAGGLPCANPQPGFKVNPNNLCWNDHVWLYTDDSAVDPVDQGGFKLYCNRTDTSAPQIEYTVSDPSAKSVLLDDFMSRPAAGREDYACVMTAYTNTGLESVFSNQVDFAFDTRQLRAPSLSVE